MKSKILQIALALILFVTVSCEKDYTVEQNPFVIAFERQSIDFSTIPDQREMKLIFSEPAKTDGKISIKLSGTHASYGVDFSTLPEAQGGILELPFAKGQSELTFTFKNLIYPFDNDEKSILMEVVAINYSGETSIQGYTTSLVSFQRSLGATLLPEIGGPNQGNQIFVDLSKETMTSSRRDVWDLGFYSGNQFRVTINGSLYMAVKKLDATNIDAVTPASVSAFQAQVAVGTFDPTNTNYIDAPNGMINQTAIAEISANDAENNVYLVNMGYTIGNTTPPAGTVAIAGDARGWKKIRILRDGDNYMLQYADLNSTTHQQVSIPKKPDYNFTFFSLATQNVVNVEPQKNLWDLCFTVFTNEIVNSGSYGYSDFVLNNLKAGVRGYRVAVTSAVNFGNFTMANVVESNFMDDQRVIGAEWRDVFTGSAYTDRFYVIKDTDGNYYKVRMLEFLNEGGVRGYPKFEYKLIQ
ncbi:HmuY family protein [Flavobacterium sp.]|uniref:HmuY family protein n=1 Tax=Flavobacterium sp. TaxID=239 RepID=UPI0026173C4D|nr:HmuY family protein [Flavobacterium sp.]